MLLSRSDLMAAYYLTPTIADLYGPVYSSAYSDAGFAVSLSTTPSYFHHILVTGQNILRGGRWFGVGSYTKPRGIQQTLIVIGLKNRRLCYETLGAAGVGTSWILREPGLDPPIHRHPDASART